MKKNSEKKLSLGKIKIASLSKRDQQKVNGGLKPQTCTVGCERCCCGG